MSDHRSLDYKLSAVKYYMNNDVSMDEVCEIFECSKTSLKRWIDKYKNNIELTRKNKNSESYKIRKIHVKYVLYLLNKNEQITMVELVKRIKKKYKDFDITPQHLGKVLRDNNKTRKRTRIEHFPKQRRGTATNKKEELNNFYNKVKEYKLDKIISIDETSIQPMIVKTYSRCQLGRRCIKKSDNNFVFRKFTLLVAISYNGLVGATLYKNGGVNKERFIEFIGTFIKGQYKNHLIILDNAKAHSNNEVKNKILETNNKYLFSIPYTPKTNAIEAYFNQLKHHLSRLPPCNNFENIRNNLKIAFTKIKKENYKNYFIYTYNKDFYKHIQRKDSTRKRKPKKYKD